MDIPLIRIQQPPTTEELINRLLKNTISLSDLYDLSSRITPDDLSVIIHRIYDLNDAFIFRLASVTGVLRRLDLNKNARRNRTFIRKIKQGFRKPDYKDHKIVLAEGDSWFNYPIILTDVIDALSMDPNIAVYSIAKGGDWLLNMLTGREYVEDLSILFPDIFLISGGGNDIVGASRLSAIVQQPGQNPNPEYEGNEFCKYLLGHSRKEFYDFKDSAFDEGIQYLSKDFFALLMFFHLQYSYLMNGILNGGSTGKTKFPGIKIITQGYDFPIPNLNLGFGWDPFKWHIPFIRLFFGNGTWLKIPLEKRGIYEPTTQANILYAMIYLFNEMMINIGRDFNNGDTPRVFHVDSRNSVGPDGWTDELHAQPKHFINTGKVFAYCIHHADLQHATYDHVYLVTDILKKL